MHMRFYGDALYCTAQCRRPGKAIRKGCGPLQFPDRGDEILISGDDSPVYFNGKPDN